MKALHYTTITLFFLVSLLVGSLSYGQPDTLRVREIVGKTVGTAVFVELGYIGTTDSIGQRYSTYNGREIDQKGFFVFQKYITDGMEQFEFYNGYLLNQQMWFRGHLVDNTKYRKVYKHFKITLNH